jgi:hypothetical protein
MRPAHALLPIAVALLAASACAAPQPEHQPVTTPTTPPAVRADPAVTRQVCVDAAEAADDGSRYFSDQLAVIERAAARGDQSTVVLAASLIQDRLIELAQTLTALAREAVSPSVRAVLTRATATLTEISSPSYPGTQMDIERRLNDVSAAVAEACV